VKTQNQKIGQRGGAAIEFAIILPFLVLLIFGAIEFGVMFYNKQVITNATREGARFAITGVDPIEVEQIVLNYCKDKDDKSRLFNLKGPIVLTAANNIAVLLDGDDQSVAVSFDYDLLFSKIIGLINPVRVSAQTTMRMEPVSES